MIGAMFLAATMRKEESPTAERIEHELGEREIIQLSTESFAVSIENELLHSQDLIVVYEEDNHLLYPINMDLGYHDIGISDGKLQFVVDSRRRIEIDNGWKNPVGLRLVIYIVKGSVRN